MQQKKSEDNGIFSSSEKIIANIELYIQLDNHLKVNLCKDFKTKNITSFISTNYFFKKSLEVSSR